MPLLSAEVMDLCTSLGKPCMVENPRNSLFSFTTAWVERESSGSHFIEDHQACAYGSARPKWTRLTANFPQVHTICLIFPQNHQHAPWGVLQRGSKRVFATSLEVHYPKKLCEAIAHAFLLRFLEQGLKFDQQPSYQHAAKASTFMQTPSLKLPPLVPQYKSRLVAFFAVESIPTNVCKVLHEVKFGVEVSVQTLDKASAEANRLSEEINAWYISFDVQEFWGLGINFDRLVVFGWQWEPMEFLQRAMEVKHPMSARKALPEELIIAVMHTLKEGPVQVANQRLLFFKKWNARAKELDADERKARGLMDQSVARAVLKFYQYPDLGVVDELRNGVDLVGDVPATSMLPFKFSPASVSGFAWDSISVEKELNPP